ncbi:MAG: protein kinase [Verrucomicrobia bacterium]|nr:protein kinase [Verrucomicrobiota bacterium]MBS0636115.1 protein kinase [Verrucomicrobiota bacterium]
MKWLRYQLFLYLVTLPLQATELTNEQFRQISNFIKYQTDPEICYYPKEKTGLSHTFEYDPSTKRHFIVLDGEDAYLASGKKKTVSKALMLKKGGVELVARGEQTLEMDTELRITKQFRGFKGLFQTFGICHHEENGQQYHTIYSKLYVPGSLKQVYNHNYTLTFYETLRAARNIARGLTTLHKRGIVHRDLGIKNYLINIPEGEPGRRKIEACIADFGRAEHTASVVSDKRVQGNTTYMAPEGHFYQELTRNSHKRLDVFALGCIYYRLFYGKKGKWQRKNYVSRDPRPIVERYEEHKLLIKKGTLKRRKQLENMQYRTNRQDFEYLILQMLSTKPSKRPTAEQVFKRLDKIYKRF